MKAEVFGDKFYFCIVVACQGDLRENYLLYITAPYIIQSKQLSFMEINKTATYAPEKRPIANLIRYLSGGFGATSKEM